MSVAWLIGISSGGSSIRTYLYARLAMAQQWRLAMAKPTTVEGDPFNSSADLIIPMLRALIEAPAFNCFALISTRGVSDCLRLNNVLGRIPEINIRLIVTENNYSILEALIRAVARGLELADRQVSIYQLKQEEGRLESVPAANMMQLDTLLAICLSDKPVPGCSDLKLEHDVWQRMCVRAALLIRNRVR